MRDSMTLAMGIYRGEWAAHFSGLVYYNLAYGLLSCVHYVQ